MPAFDVSMPSPAVKVARCSCLLRPGHRDHGHVQSFREAYGEITGDRRVTGRLENCDPVRLREAMGDAVFRESLDSTSFASVLGNAITRRMVADYRDMGQYDVWRNLADVVPLSDFRTNERTRYGGYGDLPVVPEATPTRRWAARRTRRPPTSPSAAAPRT
jgi:hypothetical protein